MLKNLKISELLIWGGLASSLIYSNNLYAGYAAPKVILFSMCLFGLCFFVNPSNIPKKHIYLGFGFLVILLLTGLLGLNFHNSFFSNPLRNTSIIFYLEIVIWIILVAALLKNQHSWTIVFFIVSIFGFLVSLIGIYEGGNRPISTIGNPSESAGYVILCIWSSLLFLVLSKSKFKWMVLIFIPFMLYYVYLSKTRSAFIALPISFFIAALYYSFRIQSKKYIFISLGTFLIFLTCFVVYFRFFQLGHNSEILDDRQGFLNMFIVAFKDNPILGIGLSNFLDVSYIYYDPLLASNPTKIDKVHSVFFEWIMAGGLLLLFYLLFVTVLLVKSCKNKNLIIQSILLGIFLCYSIWGFFSIDNTSTTILLATIITFIISNPKQVQYSKFSKPFLSLLKVGLIIPVFYSIILIENIFTLTKIRKTESIDIAKKNTNTNTFKVYPDACIEEVVSKSEAIIDTNIKKDFVSYILKNPTLLNPQSPHLLNIKAKLQSDLGENTNAIETIKKSLLKAPRFAFSQKQLAILYLQNNNIKEANECYSKILKEFPTDTLAKIQYAAINSFYLDNSKETFQILFQLNRKTIFDNLELISQIIENVDNEPQSSLFYLKFVTDYPWMPPNKYRICLNYFLNKKNIRNYSYAAFKAGQNLLKKEDATKFQNLFRDENANFNFTNFNSLIQFLTDNNKFEH